MLLSLQGRGWLCCPVEEGDIWQFINPIPSYIQRALSHGRWWGILVCRICKVVFFFLYIWHGRNWIVTDFMRQIRGFERIDSERGPYDILNQNNDKRIECLFIKTTYKVTGTSFRVVPRSSQPGVLPYLDITMGLICVGIIIIAWNQAGPCRLLGTQGFLCPPFLVFRE